jgi:hypothetical protein
MRDALTVPKRGNDRPGVYHQTENRGMFTKKSPEMAVRYSLALMQALVRFCYLATGAFPTADLYPLPIC